MSDYAKCALPKNEAAWMGGVQMKNSDQPSLKQEIDRLKRKLKDISDPNVGRIQELKEKIKKKTLITKEAIEEAAERLAERFFGKDKVD
jgi:hypothetical protein